jgi:hypothetical protein
MPSSGWHSVALVRTDVSEMRIASIIRAEWIREVWTTLDDSFHPDGKGDTFLWNVGSSLNHICHIPEDDILHSHRRGNLKSYIFLKSSNWCWTCAFLVANVCPSRRYCVPKHNILALCQGFLPGIIQTSLASSLSLASAFSPPSPRRYANRWTVRAPYRRICNRNSS